MSGRDQQGYAGDLDLPMRRIARLRLADGDLHECRETMSPAANQGTTLRGAFCQSTLASDNESAVGFLCTPSLLSVPLSTVSRSGISVPCSLDISTVSCYGVVRSDVLAGAGKVASSHAKTDSRRIGDQPVSAREALRYSAARRPRERRSSRKSSRDHRFSMARSTSRSTSRSRACAKSATLGGLTSRAA
jgi:hypothetical protein